MSVQSAYVMRGTMTTEKLRAWLIKHGHVPIKPVEHIGNEIRYRLLSKGRFVSFETEVLPNGIHLVIGFTKKLAKKKSVKKLKK